MKLDAREIHSRIAESWPSILVQLGIQEDFLSGRHGPCPACGGKDRFRLERRKDDRRCGKFYCSGCGHGDGFELLMRVYGWSFKEARRRVIEAAGLDDGERASVTPSQPAAVPASTANIAKPTTRIHRIRRESCAVESLGDAMTYLGNRHLWPLPARHSLKAHASLEYFDGGQRFGRFPALVADVRDTDGDLVTVHVTYLKGGRKLEGVEPRKLLSPLQGRFGCAVRLMPRTGDVLGVAEGIETALSASLLHAMPVWSTINATLLGRFEPPAEVHKLVIFGDRDAAGLEGSARLMERLQGKVAVELRLPPAPKKDWNDVLAARTAYEDPFDGAA